MAHPQHQVGKVERLADIEEMCQILWPMRREHKDYVEYARPTHSGEKRVEKTMGVV